MATWRCFSYQLTKVCVRDRDQSPSAALEQPARRSLRLERSLLWVNEFRDCWLGRRGGCCGLGLSWCCRCSRRALARGVALGPHSHSHVGLVDYDALCLVTLRLVAMTSWSSFRDGLTIPYRTSCCRDCFHFCCVMYLGLSGVFWMRSPFSQNAEQPVPKLCRHGSTVPGSPPRSRRSGLTGTGKILRGHRLLLP
jgi:hypothetical protein